MSDTIKIAILGLGNVGEEFAEHFLEQIQNGNKPIKIIAVAERDTESPIALGFSQNNIPVYENALDVTKHAHEIDIIFDLTGSATVRKMIREQLQATCNSNTMIAPETFTRLLWHFFDDSVPSLPPIAGVGY